MSDAKSGIGIIKNVQNAHIIGYSRMGYALLSMDYVKLMMQREIAHNVMLVICLRTENALFVIWTNHKI